MLFVYGVRQLIFTLTASPFVVVKLAAGIASIAGSTSIAAAATVIRCYKAAVVTAAATEQE